MIERAEHPLPRNSIDIPLPAALPLYGTGLAVMGFIGWRRKRKAVGADENSTEVAFRIAAGNAFEKGLKLAGPQLLEPIMKLEITTPEEHLGDFVGDLQQRGGTISNTDSRGKMSVIEARAPLAELFGYSSAMRSLSQGRAGCSIEPLEYAPAPPEVADSFAF